MFRARGILFVLVLSIAACAQENKKDLGQELYDAGLSAMADRKWDDARSLFRMAIEAAPTADYSEEAAFLSAKALDLARRDNEAVAAYKLFLFDHPNSRFSPRARFLVADVYVRLKRFSDASEVVRPETLALAGEDRRNALAKFYVDLAREFYVAPDPAQPFADRLGAPQPPVDFNRALNYFIRAQEVLGPAADLASSIAWCRLRLNDLDGAQKGWLDLVQKFPQDKRRGDAFFFLGYLHFVKNEAEKARELLSILPDQYADSPLCPAAQFLFGLTYKPNETRNEDAYRKGIAAWEELAQKYPSHPLSPEVLLAIGQSQAKWGDQAAVVATMERFLARFPQDARAPQAQFAIGSAYIALRKYDEASQAWQKFLASYPNDPLWQKAQAQVIETAFVKGESLLEADKYEEATAAAQAFLRQFPLSEYCPQAQTNLGVIAYRREQWAEAVAEYEKTCTKYPKSKQAASCALSIATLTRDKLAKSEEDVERAVRLFRDVTTRYAGTPEAKDAADQLVLMLQKSLTVHVARAYATNEKALVHVETWNVRRLSYRAYHVDLEEYFRKRQSIGAVEEIAVEIVKPDKAWEEDVPGFFPHRGVERDVELPLEGAGAWILSVSTVGDEAQGEYTATALFVRSDLSLVTKTTSSQVLVFARNEATGKPWPGAKVLVSDGAAVKYELETGADGTVLQAWDQTWGQVRVFAVSGASVASTEAALQGTVAWGYQTKGYVYTDRPVYRPHQIVNWKAILRKVGGGYYTTTAGEKVKVEVRAPNGLVLYDREQQTNEYGTVAGEVTLGDEPALGDYAIKVTLAEKDFAGTFKVLDYKKPELAVDITPEKEAYLVGEEVKAKVQVNYTFGGPVRNAEVVYQVLTGPYAFDRARYEEFGWFVQAVAQREKETSREGTFIREGRTTTDANGVAEIRFLTKSATQDTIYTVLAAAQDANRQWVSGAANVPVTTVEAFAVVKTQKRLFQPKERVAVSVLTVNALHSPVSIAGKLVVARVKEVDGHEVQEPVSDIDVKTDPHGKADAQVAIDAPGPYVIKFQSGKVDGGTPVDVAGSAEDLAAEAKVVSDRPAYLRDQTAKVLVNSPVAGVTALLTFEAEKVLEYRVVELPERSTTLNIPMKDLYAPNVFIAVAIPANHQLHGAAQEVLVFKYLKVTVQAEKPAAKPREEVAFTVRTTDQNGKPVSGEFSFALVDEAIYAIAGENAPNLLSHFYDQRRPRAVVTHSSYEFKYDGVTVASQKELLEENARKGKEEKLQKGVDELEKAVVRKTPPSSPAPAKPEPKPQEGYIGSPDGAALTPEQKEADHNESADGEKRGVPTGAFSFEEDPDKDGEAGRKPLTTMQEAMTRDRVVRRANGLGPRITISGGIEITGVWRDDQVFDTLGISWGNPGGRRYTEWVKPELRREFADTAFWASTLVTDENGVATVRVKLPDNLTTWRATARGATRDTLVGSATTSITCRKDVVARVATPRTLTQNDELTVTGTVNNALPTDQQVKYVFHADGVETETLPAQERLVHAGEVLAIDHLLRAVAPGRVTFHVEGLTTVDSDAMEIGIETLPHGVREVEGASGTVEDRAMADFVIPEGTVDGSLHAELHLAPSVDASILDALLYLEEFPYGCIEQTLDRFAPGVQALRALQGTGAPNEALAKRLDAIVKRGLLLVNQLQNPDGGWGWWKGTASDPWTTAYTIVCIEEMRKAGYAIDGTVREKAVLSAKKLFAAAGTDYDARAYLLYALSYSEEADAEDVMRCFRQREALSTYGAAVLALALKEMHRDANAAQVAEMIAKRAKNDGAYSSWPTSDGKYGWLDDGSESTSYALLALISVDPTNSTIDGAAQWLIDRRPAGTHWGSTKATAAAIRALSAWVQLKGVSMADYTIVATLNDQPLGTWKVAAGKLPDKAKSVALPAARLHGGKNTLRIEKTGSGKLYYTLRAEYCRAGEDIQPVGNLIAVGRRYEAWVPQGGQDAQTMSGYDVVRPERRPKLDDTGLREVATADRFRVHLTIDCRQELSYVLVEDPLPSGCDVVEQGMTGGFDHQERRDEKMAFFFTKLPAGKTEITYELQAVFPGKYHVMPTWASPMYRPEIFGGGAEHRLAILTESEAKRAAQPSDERPDDLYQSAKHHYLAGDLAAAKEGMHRLLDRGDLRDEIAEELLGLLLTIAIGQQDHKSAIAAYEELRDRNPNADIRLSDLREIAVAYDKAGEIERALGIYDAVLLSTWDAERGAVQSLIELGRAPDVAIRWEKNLLAWPERGRTVDEAWQLVKARVAEADQKQDVETRKRALTSLRQFLAWYPTSGAAAEADWTLIKLIEKVGAIKGGLSTSAAQGLAGEAERFLARFPDSRFADEAQHALMQGDFALGKFDETLAAGQTLLTKLYPDEKGQLRESPFRDAAHFLMGEVYHVQGALAKAVEHYQQSTVGDAKDSLEFLTAKGLKLPPTAWFGGKDPLALAVQAKNLTDVTLKVYKVDLMVLLASRKDLANVSKINLTGIAPLKEWKVTLGDNLYRWTDQKLEVPVDGKGAYLVVAKGEGLDASSILIRTEIALRVQRVENRVRVYVTDRGGQTAVKEAFVKVSDGARIIASGYTDARGVFEAGLPSAPSQLSIVAEHADDTALFRE